MIKKLSKLSLNKRTLVYLSLVVFVILASVPIAICVGARFDTDSIEQCVWLCFCAIVTSVSVITLTLKFDKWEEKIKH
ncbi:MAG: hypothetical protein UGF89_01950 [Acutalibacteraceae bacterium]|nr:hypothetical protein [Acutalibacteraceae bacterium]